MTNDTAPAWKVWGALWTVYIVWGSTYLAIRVMVETVPPLLGAGARFAVAGAVMVARPVVPPVRAAHARAAAQRAARRHPAPRAPTPS